MQAAHERTGSNESLVRLLISQTQVVFNDNAAKLTLMGLANLVLPHDKVEGTAGLLAALLVLPFILFSPLFGWMADRFPKTRVLRWALLFQCAVAVALAAALALHSFAGATACFFLLALQAALFSPAKQGILKELVGSEHLNAAVGWMESLTIVAILAGGFGGGLLLDSLTRATGNPWTGAALGLSLLAVACVTSWIVFRPVPSLATHTNEPFRLSLLTEHVGGLRRLARNRSLLGAALGIAWFYGLGGLLYLLLLQVGRETHPGIGAASVAGWLLVLLGCGIIAGAALYARLSKKQITLHALPFSVAAMTAMFLILSALSPSGIGFQIVLVGLGLASGTFIIPLNAFLQDRAESGERGRIIGAANLLINTAGIIAVAVQFFFAAKLGWNPSKQCLALAASTAVVTLIAAACQPRGWLRLMATLPVRIFYRVRIVGAGNLPTEGGALLVSNHVSYVDAVLLGVACRRPIHFLAFDAFFKVPVLGSILRLAGAIPISQQRPKEAIARAVALLKEGRIVCIFPEGELTRTGEVMGFKRGFELLARKASVPVVPVHLDSLWGSIFSFSGGRYFWKRPPALPRPITISFGTPLPGETIRAEEARRSILELGERTFRERPELRENLGTAALRRLAATPWKNFIVDCSKGTVRMNCGEILAAALTLSSVWRNAFAGRRVGVALPPGRAAVIANLALVFAGKVPVNLNLTVSQEAAESSLRAAAITEIVTAAPVRGLFPNYPWPAAIRDIAAELEGLSKGRLMASLLAVWIVPRKSLIRLFGIEEQGGNREAVLLFTSGSSGNPKGVPLTHTNVLANVNQVWTTEFLSGNERILGCLPLFHCFGMTFTLWTPLLHDIALVTTPSPLDAAKVGAAATAGKATILLGTPTFLRTYARKVAPADFATLRLAVAGAEKLPAELTALYREKYGIEIIEGYGLTETSPVLATNLPERHADQNPEKASRTREQTSHRPGSAGRLLPGIAYRLTDPETGTILPPGGTGLLHVKGPNVFDGYLDDSSQSAAVLKEGWFSTGDLVRIDEDGFLHIEGRLSRFAKIGGEMVPLAKIEETIVQTFQLGTVSGPAVAVIAIPHATKGEELVLLTVPALERETLRHKLTEEGFPNLWIPKTIRQVSSIPMLATGKIDWRGCRQIAEKEIPPGS